MVPGAHVRGGRAQGSDGIACVVIGPTALSKHRCLFRLAMVFAKFSPRSALGCMPTNSRSSDSDMSLYSFSFSLCRKFRPGSKFGSNSVVTAVLLEPKSWLRSRLSAQTAFPASRTGHFASSSGAVFSPLCIRSSLVGGPLLFQTKGFSNVSEVRSHSRFLVCLAVTGPFGQKMLRFLGLAHCDASTCARGVEAVASVPAISAKERRGW
eukprot:CAMPEP_0183440894 /NCGR_PEP_ID=MMETSP0370-20130417/83041_1 /TAXON_ID=268820 /ORGANISM="Peridinium aciculiferum, Strain PAER-2" /LENGTH=208 /DNA_ID=CAMNT_0025629923 /DNA_START=36 /DNA_END=659 /DNA_ORIENTATION=+